MTKVGLNLSGLTSNLNRTTFETISEGMKRIKDAVNDSDDQFYNHKYGELIEHDSAQIGHNGTTVENKIHRLESKISNIVNSSQVDQETKLLRISSDNQSFDSADQRFDYEFNRLQPLVDSELRFTLQDKRAHIIAQPGLTQRAIARSFAVDYISNQIYWYQNPDDKTITITRTTMTGVYVDKMVVPNGTQTNSLGISHENGQPTLWLNIKNGSKYQIAKFNYFPNQTLPQGAIMYLPSVFNTATQGISIDEYNNQAAIYDKDRVFIYNLSDLHRGDLFVEGDYLINKDEGAFNKGVALFDGYLYVLTMQQNPAQAIFISVYHDNKRIFSYNPEFARNDETNNFDGDVRLAFGLQVVFDDVTGQASLMVSVNTGAIGFRNTSLYGISQRQMDIELLAKQLENVQRYSFTTGSGEAVLLDQSVTDLKQLTKFKSYYARADVAKNIKDIPSRFNDGNHGFFIDVLPGNVYGVVKHAVQLYGVKTKTERYERFYNFLTGETGAWNSLNYTLLGKPSYLDNLKTTKLSDFREFGQWYISADQYSKLSDVPAEFKTWGCLLDVSSLMPANGVKQILTRYSVNEELKTATRIINDEGQTDWKVE